MEGRIAPHSVRSLPSGDGEAWLAGQPLESDCGGHKHRISVLLGPTFMSEVPSIPTEICPLQRRSKKGSWIGTLKTLKTGF
jgi:hypothetical protein